MSMGNLSLTIASHNESATMKPTELLHDVLVELSLYLIVDHGLFHPLSFVIKRKI